MKRLMVTLWAVLMLAGIADSGATKPPENPPPTNPATPVSPPSESAPAGPVQNLVIFRPPWLDKCNLDHDNKVTKDEFIKCFAQNISKMDTNKDGSITQREYDAIIAAEKQKYLDKARDILKKLDINKDEKLDFTESKLPKREDFDKLDTNKDSQIDQGEYLATTEKVWPIKLEQNLKWLPADFRITDINADGKLTSNEIEETATAMFNLRDSNHDGAIDGVDAELQKARKLASQEKPSATQNPGPPPLPH